MTTSQKVALPVVFGAVVFLLTAAYGLLPALVALAVIIVRMFVIGGVVALIPKRKAR
jgi:hypothetical protein